MNSLRIQERKAFDKMASLIRNSATNPAAAMANMDRIRELLAVVEPGVKRRAEAATPLTVPFVGSLVLTGGVITTPIADTELYFQETGWVVGVKAAVLEGPSLFGHLKYKVKTEAGYSIFKDGRADAFVSAISLQGNAADALGFFPLVRPVKRGEKYIASVTGFDAGNATYTPELVFLFEPDETAADY